MASKWTLGVGGVILAVDVLFWWLSIWGAVSLLWMLGTLGILTFLGVLLLGYSTKETFDKDVVQVAIAASVLTVYFALASILMFSGITPVDPGTANTIIGQFSTVVEVVVAFYMGSTTLGYAAKIWGVSKLKEDQRKGFLDQM